MRWRINFRCDGCGSTSFAIEEHENEPDDSFFPCDCGGGFATTTIEQLASPVVATPAGMQILSPIDIKPEKTNWLVHNLLPLGALAVLFAAPKCLKSWLALAIGAAVATGKAIGGILPARKGRVLIHNAEDHAPARIGGTLTQRVHALAEGHGLDHELLRANLHVLNVAHLNVSIEPNRLTWTQAATGYDLLITDPLAHHSNADENSAAEMSTVMERLRAIAPAATHLVLHHTPKAGGPSPRGSSAILAHLDTAIHITGESGASPLSPRLVSVFHRAAPTPPGKYLTAEIENESGCIASARIALDESCDIPRDREAELRGLIEAAIEDLGGEARSMTKIWKEIGGDKTLVCRVIRRMVEDGTLIAGEWSKRRTKNGTPFEAPVNIRLAPEDADDAEVTALAPLPDVEDEHPQHDRASTGDNPA